MANPTINPFDSYTLSYRSGHPSLEARIYCWKGSTRVGTIDFQKEGTSLPANLFDGQAGGWGIYIHFHLSRFDDVITTLRYEKPLHLYFTPDTLDAGIITSDHEPIGEQE
jgi:hypothetical protein